MRRDDARAVLTRLGLPSRQQSRRILAAIANGTVDRCAWIPSEYKAGVEKLDRAYRAKAAELGNLANAKSLPFHLILRDRHPVTELRAAELQTQLECYFRGTKPSLLSLLLGLVPPSQTRSSARASRALEAEPSGALLKLCTEAFRREGVAPVSGGNLARLLDWISKGRAGETLTVVSPVCPDYASERDDSGIQRYSFRGVGGGIGLAGQRVYASMPALDALFTGELGLRRIRYVVYLGDGDSFSEDNAKRMGITVPEFISRIKESRRALQTMAPRPVLAYLISELCGGEPGWREELRLVRERFGSGEFKSLLESGLVREIAQERKSLYRRWFGTKKLDDSFLHALVVSQGTEYAAMGRIVEREYRNALILAAGDARWTSFYRAAVSVPVLYLSSDQI